MDNPINTTALDARSRAKHLYWLGWKVCEIAGFLALNDKTIHSWKEREDWDSAQPMQRIGSAIDYRLNQLVLKEKKSGGDFKEIDLLHRQLERQARIERDRAGGTDGDLNPDRKNTKGPRSKRRIKNALTEDDIAALRQAFSDQCFGYQRDWYHARNQRTRMILKSRQIGATFYFAREALIDALTTCGNQIFLSASRKQAFVFRHYIVQFVREVTDKDLSGEMIQLANGAELHFLGTNMRTAQGYHGNFYFDEFFWVHGFSELNKVASAMAMQKTWRKTYFSTPSSKSHEAYAFWTGERLNKGKPAKEHLRLDLSHAALVNGRLCEDRIWRQMVTILDAQERGCDLFDIDELRSEYDAESFANLLMCEFIDDSNSVFPLALLQRCLIDSWEHWRDDYKPFAQRPLADHPVWIGYDPAESGDSAGLVVLAPPSSSYNRFRLIERMQFRGMDFAAQAESIRRLTLRYHVTYIGLDTTGMGTGVAQLVRQFFPRLTTFQYSPEIKSRLVLKTYDVLHQGRLEWDSSCHDIAQAMMAIRKTLTASGRQITYKAGRNEQTGHADLAWALMHALYNEPLEGQNSQRSGFVEFY